MESYNFGILGEGCEELASSLGKKGTCSDITFYNNVYQSKLLNVCVPSSYPEKFSSLLQCFEFADFIVVCAPEKPDYSFGETLLLIDFFKKKACFYNEKAYVKEILKTYCKDRPFFNDLNSLREWVFGQETKKDGEMLSIIDHFFKVKGAGLIILGVLKQGSVKVHDKPLLQPLGKQVLIKSIQVHDKNHECVSAPCRIGYSVKGVELDELRRGMIITGKEYSTSSELVISFRKNEFYKKEIVKGMRVMVGCGEQVVDAEITGLEPFTLMLDKKIVLYNKKILLFRNDLKDELRIIGFGEAG